MRNRNGNTLLRITLSSMVLLAATTASAAPSEAPRYHDQASAEQIEKGNFVLARRPDAQLPDYCLEQEAIYGYCEVAEEDVESLFLQAGAVATAPACGAGKPTRPAALTPAGMIVRCTGTGAQSARSVEYGLELLPPGPWWPGTDFVFTCCRTTRLRQPQDIALGLLYPLGSPGARQRPSVCDPIVRW